MLIRFDAADAHWRVAPLPGFTACQKDWLTRGGSLTAHLRMLGAVDVRVTREAVAPAWADEHAALDIAPRAPGWVREVVLSVDGVAVVAAHSITPLAASSGVWQAMRRLRNRPLAELLYSDSSVARSSLVSRRLTARHPLYRLAAQAAGGVPVHALVARRSVFGRYGAPLMVTECMLPSLWARLARDGEGAHAWPRAQARDHARPLEHTASRAHAERLRAGAPPAHSAATRASALDASHGGKVPR